MPRAASLIRWPRKPATVPCKELRPSRRCADDVDWLQTGIEPMLLGGRATVPVGGDWTYEVKWDGIRAIITVDRGVIRIRTRNLRDVTSQFPELCLPDRAFAVNDAVFDGEIVCRDGAGKPILADVMGRLQSGGHRITRAMSRHPVVCYLFDCLYLNGQSKINEPLEYRRTWLAGAVKSGSTSYRLSETVEDGEALFEAVKSQGLEGVVAKQRGGKYLPGQRTSTWLKTKVQHTIECCIIGYTAGDGARDQTFGSLHLARPSNGDDSLRYLGKVGSGFGSRSRRVVLEALRRLDTIDCPMVAKVGQGDTTWVEPRLRCEVQHASFASNGTLREPVFLRMCLTST
jgi:bifunctional non-homologous end joining protein LigD